MNRLSRALTSSATLSLLVLTCVSGSSRDVARESTGPAAAVAFRYEGTIRDTKLLDSSGHNADALIEVYRDAQLQSVQDSRVADVQGQRYLTFPQRACRAQSCPQAVAVPDTSTNPGDNGFAPFSFGARVRLNRPALAGGQNVLERGRATHGQSQWKLQVDHGAASCRWSDGEHAILAPEQLLTFQLELHTWYDLRCERRPGNEFALVSRDPATGAVLQEFVRSSPNMGPILADGPITIGAKRLGGPDEVTDQFRGDLDDIWFTQGLTAPQ